MTTPLSPPNVKVKAAIGAPISQVIQPGHAHFAMVEKVALYNLDSLMKEDPHAARLIVSLVRLMEPGAGGIVVISRQSIKELLDVSMPTVDRAIKKLISGQWVQRMKIGGAYALAVNETVAWVGPRGQMRHAVFSATVVASRSEQDEAALNPGQLRQIPMAMPGEEVVAVGMEPNPPAQQPLAGIPAPVAYQADQLPNLAPHPVLLRCYQRKEVDDQTWEGVVSVGGSVVTTIMGGTSPEDLMQGLQKRGIAVARWELMEPK